MRDIKRIDRILNKVKQLYLKCPDLSLSQSIVKALGEKNIWFYLEDDSLETLIDKYLESDNTELVDRDMRVLNEFDKVWHTYPDWRFMQVLINAVYSEKSIIDNLVSDVALCDLLKELNN